MPRTSRSSSSVSVPSGRRSRRYRRCVPVLSLRSPPNRGCETRGEKERPRPPEHDAPADGAFPCSEDAPGQHASDCRQGQERGDEDDQVRPCAHQPGDPGQPAHHRQEDEPCCDQCDQRDHEVGSWSKSVLSSNWSPSWRLAAALSRTAIAASSPRASIRVAKSSWSPDSPSIPTSLSKYRLIRSDSLRRWARICGLPSAEYAVAGCPVSQSPESCSVETSKVASRCLLGTMDCSISSRSFM